MSVYEDEHFQYIRVIILKKTRTIFSIKYCTILNCEMSKHLVEIHEMYTLYIILCLFSKFCGVGYIYINIMYSGWPIVKTSAVFEGILGHQHYLHCTLIGHELMAYPFQNEYGSLCVNKN